MRRRAGPAGPDPLTIRPAAVTRVVALDPSRTRTNFVIFRVAAANPASPAAKLTPRELRARFLGALRERGVLFVEYPHDQVRAVTHYGIEETHIDRAIVACRDALAECGAAPARPVPTPARKRDHD